MPASPAALAPSTPAVLDAGSPQRAGHPTCGQAERPPSPRGPPKLGRRSLPPRPDVSGSAAGRARRMVLAGVGPGQRDWRPSPTRHGSRSQGSPDEQPRRGGPRHPCSEGPPGERVLPQLLSALSPSPSWQGDSAAHGQEGWPFFPAPHSLFIGGGQGQPAVLQPHHHGPDLGLLLW